MSAKNPRIQVTLDHETSDLLSLLALSRHRSISAVAADLIREALDLQEVLAAHGDARLVATQDWVGHDEAWPS